MNLRFNQVKVAPGAGFPSISSLSWGEPRRWKPPDSSLDRPLPLCPAPPARVRTAADGEAIHRQRILKTRARGCKLHIQPLPCADLAGTLHLSSGGTSRPPLRDLFGQLEEKITDARRVLERHKEVHEADRKRTLLLIQLFFSPRTFQGVFQEHTSHLYMAKFLAELLGCTLPDKGTPPLFEVRMLWHALNKPSALYCMNSWSDTQI